MNIIPYLSCLIQAQVPTLVWGDAGVGKSSAIAALAKSMNRHIETVIASIREPADIGGLPFITPDGVRLQPPEYAVRLAKKGGILFFDEITTAPPAVQAALLRVILDRVVGDIHLSDVSMVAAANPSDIAAGGYELAAPLANRFAHFTWGIEADVWCAGMTGGWKSATTRTLPEEWATKIHESRALISAFIRKKPTALHNMPKDVKGRGLAWPSPRTWDMAATAYTACESMGLDPLGGVAACVGEAAAIEFMEWRRAQDIPDPETLLANPTKCELPTRPDVVYTTMALVASAVLNKLTQKRYQDAWLIAERVADMKGAGEDVALIHVWDMAKGAAGRKDPNGKGIVPPTSSFKRFAKALNDAGIMKIG